MWEDEKEKFLLCVKEALSHVRLANEQLSELQLTFALLGLSMRDTLKDIEKKLEEGKCSLVAEKVLLKQTVEK